MLPPERIAQTPLEPRDASRLLCVPRNGRTDNGDGIIHRHFRDIIDLLEPEDVLVVNETRVSAVRLFGTRSGGGKVEVLLLRPLLERGEAVWEALVRPARRVQVGDFLRFDDAGLAASVDEERDEGLRVLHLVPQRVGDTGDTSDNETVAELLEAGGRVPLPPYITAPLADKNRYQTVYGQVPGSAAAPTAGLHFTPELLARLEDKGVRRVAVRLDVGLGTFRPIQTDDVRQHVMHAERFAVGPEVAAAVNACRGRVVAVGTTALRALETAAQATDTVRGERIKGMSGETRLFVLPGYEFKAVDALITNFHQPHSTLLLLVAAFVGRDQMRQAYQTALVEGYRFLSFGDAMFAY